MVIGRITNNYLVGKTVVLTSINVGAFSGCGGNGLTTNISWDNTPNTGNAHNIIAFLNYRDKDGNIKRLASAQRNVTVKHIGVISSMGIGGGTSPSNPANNTTVNVPCGSQLFAISVATPVTDPASGIVYTWSLPSGWSGLSTSNTINVTSTAGSGGTIAVSAKRSDVSTEVIVIDALKKMTLVSDARAGIVRMYNANGSLNADTHRNNNLLSFDVGNLPRGKYFLNFTFEGNKTFTEQIILE